MYNLIPRNAVSCFWLDTLLIVHKVTDTMYKALLLCGHWIFM